MVIEWVYGTGENGVTRVVVLHGGGSVGSIVWKAFSMN